MSKVRANKDLLCDCSFLDDIHYRAKHRRSYRRYEEQCKKEERKLMCEQMRSMWRSPYWIKTSVWSRHKDKANKVEYTVYRRVYVTIPTEICYTDQKGEEKVITAYIRKDVGTVAEKRFRYKTIRYSEDKIPPQHQWVRREYCGYKKYLKRDTNRRLRQNPECYCGNAYRKTISRWIYD